MHEEPPYTPDPQRVARLQPLLRELLGTMLAWRPDV
jgi:hypothetical protein